MVKHECVTRVRSGEPQQPFIKSSNVIGALAVAPLLLVFKALHVWLRNLSTRSKSVICACAQPLLCILCQSAMPNCTVNEAAPFLMSSG